MHLEDIKDELMRDFQDEFDSVPSTSTIWRHLKELRHKRHRINRRHVREDPNEIQQYLNSVAFLETRQFVDLDGIHFNPKDYEEKWGYSLIGEEAFVFQIVIRNKTYAVHAALCEDGFLTYAIFDRNVTSEDVAAFIRDKVAPLFPPDAFLILDNAANQNHPTVHEALRLHLGGKYFFSPRYSPRHKPIERAFSMVRKWIRSNEYRYENVERVFNFSFNCKIVISSILSCHVEEQELPDFTHVFTVTFEEPKTLDTQASDSAELF